MIIEIKNYTKQIKNDVILNNINLNIKKGSLCGFIGRNGSGKSILLKSICGLLNINEGKIIINNKELGKDIQFYDKIGAVLDGSGFLSNLSGIDNVRLLASIKNKISDDEIKESKSKFGWDPNDTKKYKKYSLGMRQKLLLAQATMENPEILILDEPFNGLDNYSVESVRNILLDYKHTGKTILISSHIKDDIKLLCDEVYELDKGNLSKIEFKEE